MADHDLDGGFFVFGDLSVKIEGEFRLKFTLFEMRKCVALSTICSLRSETPRAQVQQALTDHQGCRDLFENRDLGSI